MTTHAATLCTSWPNNLFLLQEWQETLHPYMLCVEYSAQLAFRGSVSYSLHTNASCRISVCLNRNHSYEHRLPPSQSTNLQRLPPCRCIPEFLPLIEYFPQVNLLWESRRHKTTTILLGEAIQRRTTHRRVRQTSETFAIPIWLLPPHRTTRRMCRWLEDLGSDIHSIAL